MEMVARNDLVTDSRSGKPTDNAFIESFNRMKRVSREGLGEGLFANWRYADRPDRPWA